MNSRRASRAWVSVALACGLVTLAAGIAYNHVDTSLAADTFADVPTSLAAPAAASATPDEAPNPNEVRYDFTGMPDGPAPEEFGTGRAVLIPNPVDDPGTTLRVVNGKLTYDPTTAGDVAGYYSADLGAPISVIGARWAFMPRSGSPGSMALVVGRPDVNGILDRPFAVHLVVTPTIWNFGVWPAGEGELQLIAGGVLPEPLAQDPNTTYEAEVKINGDTAEIRLPNGQQERVQDPRIADLAGSYAVFEAFADNGRDDARVGFTEIWAAT